MTVTLEQIEAIASNSEAKAIAKAVMASYNVTIKLSGKGRTTQAIVSDCREAVSYQASHTSQARQLSVVSLEGQSTELTCSVCNYQYCDLPEPEPATASYSKAIAPSIALTVDTFVETLIKDVKLVVSCAIAFVKGFCSVIFKKDKHSYS